MDANCIRRGGDILILHLQTTTDRRGRAIRPKGGNYMKVHFITTDGLDAALTAAGVQSAPLVDGSGRWFGYEVYYHRPGKTWGPGGYLATRESRDWSII